MARPLPFSQQEIDDAILGGLTAFQEDMKHYENLLGSADAIAMMAATWRKMPPIAKDLLKQSHPDIYKQSTSMFGG